MAQTVSDFIVDRLTQWGITRIYGYPGDGINGLMAALRVASLFAAGAIAGSLLFAALRQRNHQTGTHFEC